MSMLHFDPERELLSQRAILPYLVDESLDAPFIRHEVPTTSLAQSEAREVMERLKSLVTQGTLPGIQAEDFTFTVQGEKLTVTCTLREK
jgi:hypothetical protein